MNQLGGPSVRFAPFKGGDQRIANKFLKNPGFYGTNPDLRWGFLSREFITQVTERMLITEGGGMYNGRGSDIKLYHANMGGHYNATKARAMKIDAVQRMLAKLGRPHMPFR
uniref:Uncharacterized protein n=1 Tax=Octactis speculum TaxID=3111310 RepID=A0A7S2GXY2_9STRA